MSDNEAWTIQVSPKLGDTLINIRGRDRIEFAKALEAVEAEAAEIVRVIALLNGTSTLASAGVTQQPAQAATGPQDPTPQPVQQQAPQAPGQSCVHGVRTRREGTNNRGAWVGYFCPLRKGDPAQCAPVFENA